jgi:glycosidase
MKVILDWVPNHTGADNRWLRDHPDFYKHDSTGKAAVPFGWTDTRQLDYNNPVLRDSMIACMRFWIIQTGIDGFRCDVAWNVPADFWKTCIRQLRAIKPLFMLAEGDKPYLPKNGFDAVYPWDLFHTMVKVAHGERPATSLDSVRGTYDSIYPPGTLELYFTSNHDENSWNGADYATFPGPAHAPFAVFTMTMPWDIPLIYSGQEEPVLRALSFFEKDSIGFHSFRRAPFYTTLLALRRRNPALDADATFRKIAAGNDKTVYAYSREKAGRKVLVILNFSGTLQDIRLTGPVPHSPMTDVFTGLRTNPEHVAVQTIEPWGYRVYEWPSTAIPPSTPRTTRR